MNHLKFRGEIDVFGWDKFNKLRSEFDDVIADAVAEVIHEIMKSDETYAYFPIRFANKEGDGGDGVIGPQIDDPLVIYLRMDFLDENDEGETYAFNLRDSVREALDLNREYEGAYDFGMSRLSSALRALAEDIDAALKSGRSETLPQASDDLQ